MFPNADLKVLAHLLNIKPEGALSFVTRLYTVENKAPLSFPGRDEGGFIPDPRLRGSLSIRVAINECKYEPLPIFKQVPAKLQSWYDNQCRDDMISQELYPFRCKGDKAIRRTRFNDLFKMYYKHPFLEIWLKKAIGLDYFRALNTIHYLCKLDETEGVEDLILRGDIDFLDERTTKLTNLLKANDTQDLWWKFAELKCLTGYRLSPWPGFDERKSTEELASGVGDEHKMYFSFEQWLTKATAGVVGKPTKWLNLRQFIESGLWLTAGSSSAGHIEIIFDNKPYKVKCRKNFVKDALTVDQLYTLTAVGEQVSTAFAKCELGKVRIAVCSDIGTYLLMAWFSYITGYPYKQWKWTTRNETGNEKIERMLKLIRRLSASCYGMAWDYKGFERQVQTKIMVDMLRNFERAGYRNIPAGNLKEWRFWRDKLFNSFDNAILVAPDSTVFKVTGGLQSGLFITSSTGDAVGVGAAEAATELLKMLGVLYTNEWTWIQGDDASYVDKSVSKLQLIDWILDAMNWEAATGKFGITTRATEFLRVAFTQEGARGYLARSIPTLTQRKPWSDSPLTPTSEIESILDAEYTCSRRANTKEQTDVLLRIWCRKNKISYIFARTPLINGGLGLGKPIAHTRGKPYQFQQIPIHADIKTNYRLEDLKAKAQEINFNVSDVRIEEIAQKQLGAIVSKDSVRQFVKATKSRWIDGLRLHDMSVRKLEPLLNIMPTLGLEPTEPITYGKYKKDAEAVAEYKILGATETEIMKEIAPNLLHALDRHKNLTRKDWSNWICAELPVYCENLNPIITEKLALFTQQQINLSLIPKNRLTDVWINANMVALQHLKKNTRYSLVSYW
jgi:hypothetical protein